MLNFKFTKQISAILWILLLSTQFKLDNATPEPEGADGSITMIDQPVLLVSTLDGTLYALEKHTGKIKWQIKEEPLVKLPDMKLDKSSQTLNFVDPLLLPDPKDGSLYLYNGFFIKNTKTNGNQNKSKPKDQEQLFAEEQRDILEKMPFTINELISSSPCRSSTGLLYTGKKSDEWLIVDALSGKKVETLSADTPFCPREDAFSKKENHSDVPKENLLMIGKTRFHLNIFNLNSRKKHWNLTVIDYSSTAAITITQSDYDLLHLTSASSGKIVTYDLESNELLWKNQLSSPIIAIFEFNLNLAAKVLKIPFSTVGTNARKKTEEQKNFIEDENDDLSDLNKLSGTMYPSIYVGKSSNLKTIYTISSFVGMEKQLISPKLRRIVLPLIEGPRNEASGEDEKQNSDQAENEKSSYDSSYLNLLVFGFYEFPDFSNIQILPQLVLNHFRNNLLNNDQEKPLIDQTNTSGKIYGPLSYEDTVMNVQFFIDFVIIFFSTICVTLITAYIIHNKFVSTKPTGSPALNDDLSTSVATSNGSNSTSNTASNAIDGWKTIGKIAFNQNHLIGRGSSGTFIYKGLFENRQEIAVKRVLSEVFLVTDREIELLSKLQHPNLVRYFITEFDDQFRYIAIELAEISLADYIEKVDLIGAERPIDAAGENLEDLLNDKQILHETCLGISHLHSQGVIHRDIKPQNILLTTPNSIGKRKVLITDFGLSKLVADTHSFSVDQICTKNFLLGTEGWTAPEIIKMKLDKTNELKEQIRSNANKENIPRIQELDENYLKSKSIDIFSLGCVFYYVLTKGKHPFGEQISRQSNIFENKANLDDLKEEEKLIQFNLIEKMLSHNPKERPPIETVLKHPFFWKENKQLQFFLCVSDRIEKEDANTPIMKTLESNNKDVVKGDWRRHISIELQTDLKKFRSYRGTSVKDLLRALRNKRHHYRELDEDLQKNLGGIPDEFCRYFTSRFPRLLIHSYIAMQDHKNEDIFLEFYDQSGDGEWDFMFNQLPRSSIRWFEQYGKKNNNFKIGAPVNSANSSPVHRYMADRGDQLVLAPNGFLSTFGSSAFQPAKDS